MKIGRETRRAARKLFHGCFDAEQLNEARVRKTVEAIALQKPRHYLAMLGEIERMVRAESEKNLALIESATPLDSQQIDGIRSELEKSIKRKMTVTHQVNPSLIGGLRIKVGSDVWDGSVSGRLQQLQATL